MRSSLLMRSTIIVLTMVLLPLAFPNAYALTLLTQIAVMIIFTLSFNLLYGETGMLSFGHALYFGAGAFGAVHCLNAWSGFPVTLLPLAGGLAGALCALLAGWFSTRRGGLTFAMISLAVAELAIAMAPMLPRLFGGEGGITTNRVTGTGWFGISYGPGIEVYALTTAWCLVSMLAMQAFKRTPLGSMANAVRDNAERAGFIGCDSRIVRWRVMMVSGFFAGIAGALGAIQFEVATGESFGHAQSAAPLIASVIGGAGSFIGPVAGAIVYTLAAGALATLTPAWPFYLGCLFIGVMLFAPDGLAALLRSPAARRAIETDIRRTNSVLPAIIMTVGALSGLAGAIGLVELTYLIAGRGEAGELARLLHLTGQERHAAPWLCAGALFVTGAGICLAVRRANRFRADDRVTT